jgi:hypothetical protein
MIDPYEKLASAIVLQAVKDYRDALRKLKKRPDYVPAEKTIKEVERFFHSDWYKELTSVDGDYLLRKIRLEASES